MPIPFVDLGEEGPSGAAGFLRFVEEPDGRGVRGALFIMSTRGEPLEFTFSRINMRPGVLWRPGDAYRHAVSALTKTLFEAVSRVPDVVLALDIETPPGLFSEDVDVRTPTCRVAERGPEPVAPPEEAQPVSDSTTLIWVKGPPLPGGASDMTIEILGSRQLLREPFDRASLGLQEAFDS